MRTPRDVGDALRHFRLRAGLSQEELARDADLHRSYVSSIETGQRRMFAEALLRLVRRLGLEIVIRPRDSDDAGA